MTITTITITITITTNLPYFCVDPLLFCLYGTSSSIWNRYSNVQIFEEINKLARQILFGHGMTLEFHYKFLVLLYIEADEEMEARK